MLNRLLNITGILAVATVLAAGGFLGYLFGTGRLDADRIALVADVLRGEIQPESPADELEPNAALAAETDDEDLHAPSASEVRARRQRQHLEQLEIERALADLTGMRELLDHAMHDVIQEQERLATEKQAFQDRRAKIEEAAEDDGFQRELAIVSGLKPAQAKEHILRVWREQPIDAVRLLNGMDDRQVQRLFEQFRTHEELDIQSEMLEQIRTQGLKTSAVMSGKTQGAAMQ